MLLSLPLLFCFGSRLNPRSRCLHNQRSKFAPHVLRKESYFTTHGSRSLKQSRSGTASKPWKAVLLLLLRLRLRLLVVVEAACHWLSDKDASLLSKLLPATVHVHRETTTSGTDRHYFGIARYLDRMSVISSFHRWRGVKTTLFFAIRIRIREIAGLISKTFPQNPLITARTFNTLPPHHLRTHNKSTCEVHNSTRAPFGGPL